MTSPPELSATSKDLLEELSFTQTSFSDRGMWKVYLWTNPFMQFALIFDRGYYDCNIIPRLAPINSLALIRLLKFLRNNKTFYNKELAIVNLSRTLKPDEYVRLFYDNYALIKAFMENYNQDKFDCYDQFKFDYDSI